MLGGMPSGGPPILSAPQRQWHDLHGGLQWSMRLAGDFTVEEGWPRDARHAAVPDIVFRLGSTSKNSTAVVYLGIVLDSWDPWYQYDIYADAPVECHASNSWFLLPCHS